MFEFFNRFFAKPIYCKINDTWYDLKYIAYTHPGGSKFLEKFHLEDITDKFYSISSHDYVDLKKIEKYKVKEL